MTRKRSSVLASAILAAIAAIFSQPFASAAEVLPGVEVLAAKHAANLKGKRVGILTNPTGVDRQLRHTIDIVRELPGVEVVRLFAPEHGVRGGFYAGDKVDESKDPLSGLPIASLYGKTRRPTPEMLAGLDVVLYDIQDVGVRHYTFISSLTYMMEECEKAGIEVWVLDRPEPMGGNYVAGPMMEPGLISFIGIHTLPKCYGMTPGEFARMIQAERTPKLKLRVIELEGWKRGMTYGDLGWIWVPPSQHIPHWETCYWYAMTGVIGEISKINVGVGTPAPFEVIGMPGLDGVALAERMNALKLPGIVFRATTFTPKYGSLTGKACQGVQLHVRDLRAVDPERVCLELMAALRKLTPDPDLFKAGFTSGPGAPMFMLGLGDARLGETIARGGDLHDHDARNASELKAFRARREKFLLYP